MTNIYPLEKSKRYRLNLIERIYLWLLKVSGPKHLKTLSDECLEAVSDLAVKEAWSVAKVRDERLTSEWFQKPGANINKIMQIQTGLLNVSPDMYRKINLQLIKEHIELAMIAGYSPDELHALVSETIEEKEYIYDGNH